MALPWYAGCRELDDTTYPKGIKITDKQMRTLETRHLTRHDVHGERN